MEGLLDSSVADGGIVGLTHNDSIFIFWYKEWGRINNP